MGQTDCYAQCHRLAPRLHGARDAWRVRHHQHERAAVRPRAGSVLQSRQLCADARQQPELQPILLLPEQSDEVYGPERQPLRHRRCHNRLDEIEVIGHKSNGLVPFRSEDVCVTFDRGANGFKAIDINYINGQHVSPQNAYARYLQNLIRNTPGYLENYGPFIINKVVKGKVIPAPWAREIRGGHYDHVHISMPK